MAFNKKVLALSGVTVVLALAMTVVGVKSCNDNNEKDAQNAKIKKELNDATNNIKNANEALKKSIKIINLQKDSIQNQADSIVVLNDSIKVLNDSLEVVNWKLGECEKEKKFVKKPGNNSSYNNRKPQPVKSDDRNSESNIKNDSKITLGDNVKNNGVVNIENQNNKVSNSSTIELGDGVVNEGNITINNGDVVNNYYTDENVDTASTKNGMYKVIMYKKTITRKTYSR